jgi:hypothetical protein
MPRHPITIELSGEERHTAIVALGFFIARYPEFDRMGLLREHAARAETLAERLLVPTGTEFARHGRRKSDPPRAKQPRGGEPGPVHADRQLSGSR